jgi:hypothetical protein
MPDADLSEKQRPKKVMPISPGRPKGVPNKNTAALKDMILNALAKAGGEDYLKQQAAENPGPFLTLVGKVLPLQLTGDASAPIVLQLTNTDERL